MQVTFYGAAGGVVTGSSHLLTAAGKRILLDCGMVQGSREAEALNAQPFAFDPTSLDALVLSHAHIDHIGRVPLLVKRGFNGPIFAQAATCDLLPIMLLDAASVSQHDADATNRHRAHDEPEVEPLYTADDVAPVLKLLHPLPYDTDTQILPGVTLRLHDAGHILGSCMLELRASDPAPKTLLFSGDIGMKGTPILRDPSMPPAADLILMESTYGDRNHKDRAATVAELGEIFAQAHAAGGNVIIPAFAVGRSQELLYWCAQHFDDWKLSQWKIFLDSPMAAKVMGVYDRHEELFDADALKVWQGRIKPFEMPNLQVTASPDESKAQLAFADKYNLPFHLLADVGHKVADAYGVWGEKMNYGKTYMGIDRTTFVIAPDGTLRFIFRKVKVNGHSDEVLTAIRETAEAAG